MPDQVASVLAFDGIVRIYAAVTTDLVEEARRVHDTWPTATAALGRALTAAVLMATMGDPEEKLSLQFLGDGPLGRIMAIATGEGSVKGYVDDPHVDLDLNERGKLDVGGAVGSHGKLYVIRDLGLREPYRGVVELVSGEIAEDIAHYFLSSQQTRTAVALGVMVSPEGHVEGAGGYILQLLPGADERIVSQLEEILAGLPEISSLVLEEASAEGILRRWAGENHRVAAECKTPQWHCECSRERLIGPLVSLGAAELRSLAQEEDETEMICQFCRTAYRFDREELMALASRAEKSTQQEP